MITIFLNSLTIRLEITFVDNMCKVYNKYSTVPARSVYIGRGSAFGNPFVIGRDGDRDAVCDKYKEMVASNAVLRARIKSELRGKDLVCFCAPKRCHGDLLLELANSDEEEDKDEELSWDDVDDIAFTALNYDGNPFTGECGI